MEKDVFDSMCDRYEARIQKLDEEVERCHSTIFQNAMSEVCVKKGGHEFDSRFSTNISRTCKFCGFVEHTKDLGNG